jgi:diaminopimelate decarboxylase
LKALHYHRNVLNIEQLAIDTLADEIGTPFYCYSQNSIEAAYNSYQDNLKNIDSSICYAIKANSNQAIIKVLADLGAGADVVSEGELRRALAAGIPANKIVFSGVAKTATEMEFALQQGVKQFNVESENELLVLNQVACKMDKIAPIAFRINPNVDANTHAKISTGKSENKFGIPIRRALEVYQLAASLDGILVQGVDVHIGSQLTQLEPFRNTFVLVKQLVEELKHQGHSINTIDVGGGLGVDYNDDAGEVPQVASYCALLEEIFAATDCHIILEPGRSLVAASGIVVSRVVYKKQGDERTFVIIDAAMNDLLRPSMYDAYHKIVTVNESDETEMVDIVGPVCETADTFARNRSISKIQQQQLIVIQNCGAYGAVMSSCYNTRLLIPEVLVKGNQFSIIKKRTNYDVLIGQDQYADWQ